MTVDNLSSKFAGTYIQQRLNSSHSTEHIDASLDIHSKLTRQCLCGDDFRDGLKHIQRRYVVQSLDPLHAHNHRQCRLIAKVFGYHWLWLGVRSPESLRYSIEFGYYAHAAV